jgi:hypothetical protein
MSQNCYTLRSFLHVLLWGRRPLHTSQVLAVRDLFNTVHIPSVSSPPPPRSSPQLEYDKRPSLSSFTVALLLLLLLLLSAAVTYNDVSLV